MAERIKVSTEQMASTISRDQAEKTKLLEAFQVCVQASQLLAQSWAGPSFLACSAKLALTYKNLFQSEQKMDDAIQELTAAIGIYTETETSVTNSAAALDTGSSPF